MFAGFSFRYYINSFTIEIVRNRKVHSKVILTYIHEKFPDNLYPRDWNSLMCRSPSLEKKHLLDIYDSLHILMGSRISSPCDHDVYSSGNVFGTTTQHFRTDYLVVGTIPVVPTEQAVTWVCELTDDDLIPFRYDQREYSCVLPADFARSVDHLPCNICLFKGIAFR